MPYRYLVLGAGRQGVAAAYELARAGDAAHVTLADIDEARASAAAARIAALAPSVEVRAAPVDARDEAALERLLASHDAALSAMSYKVNEATTRAAISAGCHLNDLGGHTGVVRAQIALDGEARAAGVSIVPDCGLAPGLGNLLAAYAHERLGGAEALRIRCGGLPQRRVGPLDYKIVFSVEGLTNEYSGEAEVLRGGRRERVPAFTEPESLDLPAPVGAAEAFVTSGGLSTLCEQLEGEVASLDYKTVRYPGHYDRVRAMIDLGFLSETPVEVAGQRVVPRELVHTLWGRAMAFPEEPDLVVLRVEGEGGGRLLRLDLVDRQDEVTGFSAMERCTAFPAVMVTIRQARGEVTPGAHRVERAFPLAPYVAALGEHGLALEISERAVSSA